MSVKPRVRSILAGTVSLSVAAGLGLAAVGAPSTAADSRAIRPQAVTPPATTYAVVKTIGVGAAPENVAVNDADDTVYVTNYTGQTLTVIDGGTGLVTETATFATGANLWGVAVNQGVGTVAVTVRNRQELILLDPLDLSNRFTSNLPAEPYGVAIQELDDSIYFANGNSLTVIGSTLSTDTVGVGSTPYGVAINQADDTVYVANQNSASVTVLSASNLDDSVTLRGFGEPWGVAVDQSDDTVYVTNAISFGPLSNSLTVINGSNTDDSTAIKVGSGPTGVAVNQADDTVYVANFNDDAMSAINGRNLDDSELISVGNQPVSIAVDGGGSNQGLIYVVNRGDNAVSVIARVSPTVSPGTGSSGDTVTVTVDAPQVAYDVDDSTIESISIGGVTATGLAAGAGDTWTVTAPAGTGTVPVVVTFAGGLTASAGSFTYGSAPGPTPAPTYPPSAPLDVTGVAGDRQAVVSWSVPASSGSFPITNYEAVVSPGGQSCLVQVPELSCAIEGLANGTAYTARVRALNGAGWGAYSVPSGEFTPVAPVVQAIVISGSRGDVRGKAGIQVSGSTTGFAPEASLRPWHRFPGQTGYTEGLATIRIQDGGDFTWQRRTGKTITVVVRSMDGTVESNRLILAAG